MIQTFKKENVTKRYEVQDGKVLCTIQIGDKWVSNPTLEQFLAQGWEEYTPPEQPAPEPYIPTFDELYEQKVVELIREKYDINKELALHRQRYSTPAKTDEFDEYYSYCEECKRIAYDEIEKFMENIKK